MVNESLNSFFTQEQPHRKGSWWKILLTGMALFLVGFGIMVMTSNPNLFPTVVFVGSFVVPVTFVAFFYERRHWSNLSISSTLLSFAYGGVLAVFLSAFLEPIFISSLTFTSSFMVGLIEETAKILGIILIARNLSHDSEIDGVILGAAAGMGFAALESAGYAFSAFLTSGGSLSAVVFVTMLRSVLAPFGHGVWTGILAGVLFRESKGGRFHINLKVIGAWMTVIALHGLWDGGPILISTYTNSGVAMFAAQAVVGFLGVGILWNIWRQARRNEITPVELPQFAALPESASVEEEEDNSAMWYVD
ncbi:MAG: PrsW family intramembrane metalloprotease [Chloroflexi bacterium]|nr:PrsW family intramembrane metalloprotease [Chloroflexota bacterium]